MAALSSIVMAAASIAGAALSYKTGQDQKNAAERANRIARENANRQAAQAEKEAQQLKANVDKQEKASEMAANRANQKSPDTRSILDAARQAGKSGVSGTMLTGPAGVDPALLSLGKNTLLGQ
ncbi:MAG TPA: hypothetical protein PKZ67_11160 [Accumulibacter sp.]|nr:hypothetical protein [Accumulibacter sp.]